MEGERERGRGARGVGGGGGKGILDGSGWSKCKRVKV